MGVVLPAGRNGPKTDPETAAPVRQSRTPEKKDGKADPDKRMLIFRFWAQAKNYDMAKQELDRL